VKAYEELKQRRIEYFSTILAHDGERVIRGEAPSVAPAGGERVEYIGYVEDPG